MGAAWELRVDQSSSRMAQLKRRVEPAVRLVQAGLPGRILGRLIHVSFLDRTVILAGQAFSALLPLIMVVNTVSPHPGGDSPAAALARRLGLGPRDVSSLQSTIAPPHLREDQARERAEARPKDRDGPEGTAIIIDEPGAYKEP